MKLVKYRLGAGVLAAALLGPAAVWAADGGARLQPQSQGTVSFVSGGVGDDEAAQIKQMRSGYPLELLFVTKGNPNQYLADVKVKIADGGGKVVLDTTASGPFLLAKMPPGRYAITADSDGSVKRQTVQVGAGKPQRVVFVWPQAGE